MLRKPWPRKGYRDLKAVKPGLLLVCPNCQSTNIKWHELERDALCEDCGIWKESGTKDKA